MNTGSGAGGDLGGVRSGAQEPFLMGKWGRSPAEGGSVVSCTAPLSLWVTSETNLCLRH